MTIEERQPATGIRAPAHYRPFFYHLKFQPMNQLQPYQRLNEQNLNQYHNGSISFFGRAVKTLAFAMLLDFSVYSFPIASSS